MSRFIHIKEVDRRVRASREYAEWVNSNKASECFKCGSKTNLECHHLIEMYHLLLGLHKFYGDWETVYEHAVGMHKGGYCEPVTLCDKCHQGIHPGRPAVHREKPINPSGWTCIPRKFKVPFSLGTKSEVKGALGLVAFQTVFGIGWHILNDGMADRMVTFNRRRFAELLGKTPSVSFFHSLDVSMVSLKESEIVSGYCLNGNDYEVHLSSGYEQSLRENPWFLGIFDIRTSRMMVLVLRWLLSMQGRRRHWAISPELLSGWMCIETKRQAWMEEAIVDACAETGWAKCIYHDGKFRFSISQRPSTPVYSLRNILLKDSES